MVETFHMLLAGLFPFALCMLLMPAAMYIAPRVGLVDVPGERKRHSAATPLVGGIVIFLSLCLSNILLGQISWSFLGWMGLVLVIGVLDDLYDVSYRIRLATHAAIVGGIFITDGLLVNNIGAIFGGNPVDFFGVIAVVFTAIGVIGAINAVNMVDGADGLLASLMLASLVVLILFGMHATTEVVFSVSSIATLIGALAAFAVLNCRFFGVPRARVFMGDAGSTMLGFMLVYLLIDFSQGSAAVISPVLAGWILGLPLLDASAVIAIRLLDGKAPFHPDRRHLHHLLLDTGYSVNKTVLSLLAVHVAIMAFASAMYLSLGNAADQFLFWGFVCLVLVRVVAGSVYSRVLGEKQSQPPSKTPQVRAFKPGSAGAIATRLGLPESHRKSNDSVKMVDVEHSSD